MNLDKFRREFSQLVLRGKELQPLTHIQGTNSALIQRTINLAVSCIEEGEAYFEVGCLFGSSLAAASAGNEDKLKYIADVSWQGEVPKLLGTIPNLKSHLGDFFELDLATYIQNEISVFYYDADHSYKCTLEALERIIPYLADKALILMDDLEYGSTYNAWRKFQREHADQFTIVNEFWTKDKFIACTKGFKEDYWDGFGLMEYQVNFEEEDESIANVSVEIWHGMGKYKERHGTLHPKEYYHLHGQEEHQWD